MTVAISDEDFQALRADPIQAAQAEGEAPAAPTTLRTPAALEAETAEHAGYGNGDSKPVITTVERLNPSSAESGVRVTGPAPEMFGFDGQGCGFDGPFGFDGPPSKIDGEQS